MLKDILRWVCVAGTFAVPIIIPFIVSASMFFPYITGKNFTFRIIVEVMLSAWVLLALLDARYRPKFSFIISAIAIFVTVVGVADALGANPFKSFWSNFERMEGFITLLHLAAYFVVASTVLQTEKMWRALWYTTLGTSVIVALTAIVPFFKALNEHASLPRIDASFGNPIYLAVYSLFHIFIACMLAVRWRGKGMHNVTMGAIALLHIVVMVLTQTRGTVLGFAVGAVITTVLIALFERERTLLRRFSIGALLALALLVSAGVYVRDTEWAKQTPLVNRFTQVSLSGGTVQARFMNWGMAWEGVKERPLLGWGQGNYEYVFSKYYNPKMVREEPWFDRTHDIIFDWLIAAGFLGLFAYLFILVSVLLHLWVLNPHDRTWSLKSLTSFSAIRDLIKGRDETFTATERALWTGLLAAYFVHNLFVFDNIVSYILFFTVLAYIHWRVTRDHSPLWEHKEVAKETVTSVVLPVVVVLMGFVMWYANIRAIQTSQELIHAIAVQKQLPDGRVVNVPPTPEEALASYKKALSYDFLGRQEVREQLLQKAASILRSNDASDEVKKEFRDLTIQEMERELERNPLSARLWLFLGSFYASAGQLENAERAFIQAVERTPTKQAALFQLGEVKLRLGKNEEALVYFKKAYELLPEYEQALKLYAIALIRNGKDKEAVDLLTERYGTPAIDDSLLFNEWANAKRYDITAQILEKRVEENPNNIQARVSLAAAYKKLGKKDEAIAILKKIKQENPEYAKQMDTFIKDVRGW